MNPPTPTHHPESLEARVIWLHDVGGLIPREIAWRLGVPEARVEKILAAAQPSLSPLPAEGPDADGASGRPDLARALCARYGLQAVRFAYAEVGESPMETVSRAGAAFLGDEIRTPLPNRLIAISHGRTVAGAAALVPRLRATHVRFVSLVGDLTARRSAYPHEVMYTLARRLGAEAFVMPAPLYLPTVADKEALERISFIRDIQAMQAEADTLILGIGQVDHETQRVPMGTVETEALDELVARGAAGEVMGRFIDDAGQEIASDLSRRTFSPDLHSLRDRRIVGMAGGPGKLRAIRAMLASGLMTELVTDHETALALAR